jgi:putative flippase GtrA
VTTQTFRYVLAGGANTALGYATILSCQYGLGLSALVSNALGYMLGMVTGYALHKRYTFRSTRGHRATAPAYLGSIAISYLFNVLTLQALLFLGLPAAVAQALAVITYAVTFYLLGRIWVFDR